MYIKTDRQYLTTGRKSSTVTCSRLYIYFLGLYFAILQILSEFMLIYRMVQISVLLKKLIVNKQLGLDNIHPLVFGQIFNKLEKNS